MVRTIIIPLLTVTLTYLCLSFAQWNFNPADWSVLSRAILIIMLLLSVLKPIVDAITRHQQREMEEFVNRKKAERDSISNGQ